MTLLKRHSEAETARNRSSILVRHFGRFFFGAGTPSPAGFGEFSAGSRTEGDLNGPLWGLIPGM